jgi:glycosyltransferase involved in cell wall biosynthesis
VPLSDGFIEGLGCDLVHFPTQLYTVCAMRSVYNPIDLQHLHYPEFFSSWEIAWRETVYRAGCQLAQMLIVNSGWIKDDVVRQYGVNAAKVRVVPEAPPVRQHSPDTETADADSKQLCEKYRLDGPFVLYPAVTWPHKNHLRLFDALAHLRDHRGIRLQLLCTGSRFEPFWPQVEARLRERGLEPQVKFLGHIPAADLRRLYRSAMCLVLPSLFEANSLPVFEAWQEGAAVVCSNATGLPEQVADAALLFDPNDTVAIADALNAVAAPDLQATLRARGYRRATQFSWEQTVTEYRAIYRRVAGRDPIEPEPQRS